jgi:hypothetical protein
VLQERILASKNFDATGGKKEKWKLHKERKEVGANQTENKKANCNNY